MTTSLTELEVKWAAQRKAKARTDPAFHYSGYDPRPKQAKQSSEGIQALGTFVVGCCGVLFFSVGGLVLLAYLAVGVSLPFVILSWLF